MRAIHSAYSGCASARRRLRKTVTTMRPPRSVLRGDFRHAADVVPKALVARARLDGLEARFLRRRRIASELLPGGARSRVRDRGPDRDGARRAAHDRPGHRRAVLVLRVELLLRAAKVDAVVE